MQRTSRGARGLIAAAALASAGAGGALAQTPALDAAKGHELAEKLCTSCHIVGKEAAGASVPADVPSFLAIASRPGQTAEAIAGRIVLPHPPMPQIQLTRSDIAELATYILSLKSP